MIDSSAVAKAKDTLLRALDQLEQAESDLDGAVDRVDLVVVYSIGTDLGDGGWHEVGGWSTTAGPKWLHAALMRRAAESFDDAAMTLDDEPEGEED